ncbi:MAG: YybH family protein [Ardenticatenaceae bacterium]
MKRNKMDFAALVDAWIAAWNAHDLERVFELYVDDFEMRSQLIVKRGFSEAGILRGKQQIRPYWSVGMSASPALKFELIEWYAGVSSVCIVYNSVGRQKVCETLFVNDQGKIVLGVSHHLG